MTSTLTEARRSSAYPPAVDELLPRARELTAALGELPSRNRLMRELRIGAGKAAAVLAELASHEPTTGPTSEEPSADQSALWLALAEPQHAEPAPDAVPVAVTDPAPTAAGRRQMRVWPVLLLTLGAFVSIWSGWVGLGGLTGFGVVHPLPGIWDGFAVNTAITLPVGMETYAAFALRAWLSPWVPVRARRFARRSTIAALTLGAAGQVAYHLMTAAGVTQAPWWITTVVACLPVAVLGMGAALAHLVRESTEPRPEVETGSRAAEVSR